MEEARAKFKETVINTKLFFTKNKKEAEKISYNQFDNILNQLKTLLTACNEQGNDKEDDGDDDWTEDVEEAIVKHGDWTKYEADMKKFKEQWKMERFRDEFILSADEGNSNNKNKNRKRNRSKSIEILNLPKKKRKQNAENGISDEEVCLVVLFIHLLLPKGI